MSKFIRSAHFFIVLVVSITLLASGVAIAQDLVRVLFVKGNPKMMKSGTNEWIDCKVGLVLDNGDRVKTLNNDVIEISFLKDNSNIIKIDENSDVLVRQREAPYSIELLNGEVMSLIKKLPKRSSFEVRTPAGLSGARGTGWRSRTTGAQSIFDSFERSIYAKGIDPSGREMEDELIVRSGWRTSLNKFEKPTHLERLSREDFEKWNRWKEELADHIGIREGSVSALDKIAAKESKLERVEKEGILERRDVDKIRDKAEPSSGGSGGESEQGPY